ncbi:class I SAM-dependent methyltransferase, partial [Nitratireductor sp. ZSWI3]|uniref:class I SAM-dependent methyltransferase n=1 Tax=Nitratireductor sp. ZSWI3 TaxID=2966359 RepID=UPI0021505980
VKGLLDVFPRAEVVDRLVDFIARYRQTFQTALAVEVIKLGGGVRLQSLIDPASSPLIENFGALVQGALLRPSHENGSAEVDQRLLTTPIPDLELNSALALTTKFCEFGKQESQSLKSEEFLAGEIFELSAAMVDQIEQLTFCDEGIKGEIIDAEKRSAYQTYALEQGRLDVTDIYSGAPAEFLGSFVFWDKFVYAFRGRGMQYLVASGGKGEILGLYLPAEDLFLHFTKNPAITEQVWSTVKTYLAREISKRADRPFTSVQEPELIVRICGIENFAHHAWNYFGGLEKANLVGLLPRIRNLEYVGTEFFGPIQTIYPELATSHIEKPRQGPVKSTDAFGHGRLVIPLGSHLLFPQAINRITSLADEAVSASDVLGLTDAIQRYRRRFYVALRVGDKSWLDAEQELPKLINRILTEDSDACFVLDGFSVPVGEDHVSQRWEQQIEKLTGIVSGVLSQVTESERVFNIMGLDLLKSIGLMRLCTFYITPIGTAHHKVDWFSDIDGVLYLSPDYKEKPVRRMAGMAQRLGKNSCSFAFGDMADTSSVRLQSSSDVRPNLSNFTCSWETIWMDLKKHISSENVRDQHQGVNYLQFIGSLHDSLKPESYFEIGTAKGSSLKLAQCDAVAIDPKFQFDTDCIGSRNRTFLIQEPSDHFFRNNDLRTFFPGGVDLAFLDGMHLFEFLLRDLLHVSRYVRSNSVVLLHDCFPITERMALREQQKPSSDEPFANWWTGDVWKILYAIRKYMPQVSVTCLDCPPTGLVALTNVKGVGDVLENRYFEIVSEFIEMDKEPGWLDRLYADFEITSSQSLLQINELRKRFWL